MMPPSDRIYDPGQGAKKDLTDTGDNFLAIGPALRIMQLNVEGLSAAKRFKHTIIIIIIIIILVPRMTEVVSGATIGAVRRAKLQSNRHHRQTNTNIVSHNIVNRTLTSEPLHN